MTKQGLAFENLRRNSKRQKSQRKGPHIHIQASQANQRVQTNEKMLNLSNTPEMQIKSTIRYHFTLIWRKLKILRKTSAGKDMEH